MSGHARDLCIGLAGSIGVAALLHGVDSRPDIAWAVPLLVVWGLTLSVSVRGSPTLGLSILAGLLCRLALVGTPPLLSDDLYRYLFEGRVLLAGENPFLHPPAELASLAPELAARVNHPTIPSIYPPVAQVWFRLLALVGTGAWVAQAGMALVDLGNVALIHRLQRDSHRPTWPALLYAVHPLPVVESAQGAHLESLGVFFALCSLLGLRRGSPAAMHAMLLGVGTKLLPVLLLPALLRRLGLRRALPHLLLGGLGLLLLAAPVLSAGPALFEAFGRYRDHWSFNGLLHPLLTPSLGERTRPVLLGLGLLVAARASALPPLRAWFLVGSAFLMLSPTVHPWYVLWALVPALLLERRDWAFGAVALQASYLVLGTLDVSTGSWTVPGWLGPLTWGGVALGFAVDAYARRLPSPTTP